jgi:D-methionine transport system substrate-binding protein
VGYTYISPLGIYSQKLKSPKDLPQGGKVADVAAAVINTNYALAAGLQPTRNAIALEDIHSPYANIIAVRTQDKDKPWVKKLVAAYQSEDVKQFMKNEFKGAMVPSF